jgi:hypothetical protein
MKRFLIALALTVSASFSSFAQLTSLSENMNSTCPASANAPYGWDAINSSHTPNISGKWRCDISGGRYGSAGISCSGLYGSPAAYHLDTSVLISPPLNLSGYTDIYLNFDSKTTLFNLGAKLELLVSGDSTMDMDTFVVDTSTVYNKTSGLFPLFSTGDESDWVTHQIDLTALKNIVPLYVGFRYTSANGTSGSTWYLDNINTTTAFLSASDNNRLLPSTKQPFTSWYSDDALNIASNLPHGGTYTMLLTDMAGRLIIHSELSLSSGKQRKAIPAANLASGLYLLSIRGENEVFTTRLPVQH